MRKHLAASIATASAIALGLCLPTAMPAGEGGIPRLSNGKPDFNGVWQRPYVPDMAKSSKDGSQKGEAIPFTAEYAEKFKNYDPAKFDYTGHCLPQGLTRSMNSPFPIRIVQTPEIFTILYEAWNVFEIVPTDGRGLPKNPDALWAGSHAGTWDGDTLVVESIGFNEKTNLDTVGHPHSDALHTIERFTRTDDKHLSYEITLDDPKAFTKPWKNTRIFTLRPDWEVMEYSCEENNKDFNDGHIK